VHLQFYIRNAAPSDSGSRAAALTRENYLTAPALHGHVPPCQTFDWGQSLVQKTGAWSYTTNAKTSATVLLNKMDNHQRSMARFRASIKAGRASLTQAKPIPP